MMRCAFLSFLALAGAVPRADIEWGDDLKAATELARKTGKPLFIVFRCEP